MSYELMTAIVNSDLGKVKHLIEAEGLDPNGVHEKQPFLVYCLCAFKRYEIAKYLISKGTSVFGTVYDYEVSMLDYAVAVGGLRDRDMVLALINDEYKTRDVELVKAIVKNIARYLGKVQFIDALYKLLYIRNDAEELLTGDVVFQALKHNIPEILSVCKDFSTTVSLSKQQLSSLPKSVAKIYERQS